MAKKEVETEGGERRRGRYVGTPGRRFESVPFGDAIVPVPGQTYELHELFRYLWEDPHFAVMWEWEGDKKGK